MGVHVVDESLVSDLDTASQTTGRRAQHDHEDDIHPRKTITDGLERDAGDMERQVHGIKKGDRSTW